MYSIRAGGKPMVLCGKTASRQSSICINIIRGFILIIIITMYVFDSMECSEKPFSEEKKI